MKLLVDFLPVIFFFITFKFYGLYYATAIAIALSIGQVLFTWLHKRNIEMMQIVTLILIVVFGGATLWLQDEIYIKWKPTAVNWSFAALFIIGSWLMKKPLIQTLLEKNVTLPTNIWQRLNSLWVVFFVTVGFANLYVVYHFNTNVWVNFKLFGIIGLTVAFLVVQAIYISKYVDIEAETKPTTEKD